MHCLQARENFLAKFSNDEVFGVPADKVDAGRTAGQVLHNESFKNQIARRRGDLTSAGSGLLRRNDRIPPLMVLPGSTFRNW